MSALENLIGLYRDHAAGQAELDFFAGRQPAPRPACATERVRREFGDELRVRVWSAYEPPEECSEAYAEAYEAAWSALERGMGDDGWGGV